MACTAVTLVAVTPAAAVSFANTTAIITTDPPCVPAGSVGPATLYPSPIAVSGLTGTVADVNVTLTGMNKLLR